MKKYSLLFGLAISILPYSANAYELATHARLTLAAHQRSMLANPQFLQQLGIPQTSNPFGNTYYDVSAASVVRQRQRSFFETNLIPGQFRPLSIEGWLMTGSIREDDAPGEDNPQDDPYDPDIIRPLRHFYDPVNNRGLEAGLSFTAAPNWALGSTDAFTLPNNRLPNRQNHFTVFDAREAMYRALTGMSASGSSVAPTVTERNRYWATTFRALGDMVHLVQDMGQPQHTRNDPHSGVGPGLLEDTLTGHKSIYEAYIEARATGGESFKIDGAKVSPVRLDYGSYPIPVFNNFSSFWSTRDATRGLGLADYSNRGFFTAGTNIGSNNSYALPSNDSTRYTQESAAGLLPSSPGQKINFLRGVVSDFQTPGVSNIRLSTESLFDFFMAPISRTYSLNRFNYDDMANLLIPRAVGYSAGLINYFFRGRLAISLPDEGVYGIVDHSVTKQKDLQGFNKIKLKLRNITPDAGGTVQAMDRGTLVAVAKFHRNTCYLPDLSDALSLRADFNCRSRDEEIRVSTSLPNMAVSAETPQALTFNFTSPIPINATDLFLQVVYRGRLGTEDDAVVVATQDVSEPNFTVLMNISDYMLVNGQYYTAQMIRSTPSLFRQVDLNNDGFADVDLNPFTVNLVFSFGSIATGRVIDLPPARYVRVASITNPGDYPFSYLYVTSQGAFSLNEGFSVAAQTQLNSDGTFFFSYLAKLFRGAAFVNNYIYVIGYYPDPNDGDPRILPVLQNLTPLPINISF